MKLNYTIIFFLITQVSINICMENNFESLFPEEEFINFLEPEYVEINKNFRKHFGYSIPEALIEKKIKNKTVYALVPKAYHGRKYQKNSFFHMKNAFAYTTTEIDTFNPPPLPTKRKKIATKFSHKTYKKQQRTTGNVRRNYKQSKGTT